MGPELFGVVDQVLVVIDKHSNHIIPFSWKGKSPMWVGKQQRLMGLDREAAWTVWPDGVGWTHAKNILVQDRWMRADLMHAWDLTANQWHSQTS